MTTELHEQPTQKKSILVNSYEDSGRALMGVDVFERMAKRDHEQVVFCQSKCSGLRAIIAIHSTTLGPALGGVRMWPYATEEDALKDVLRLSRGMTYKAAVTNLALGGGKAVIIGDPKTQKTRELLEEFGRFVDTLNGRYITAEDVGMSVADIDIIRTQTKHVVGTAQGAGGSGDPSPYTALGIYVGISACAERVYGSPSLKGKRILVQGAGAVGGKLAKRLVDDGAIVFVADIDSEKIAALKKTAAVQELSHEKIFETDCDIFAPCALGGILNDTTIPKLRCRIVAGGANNQLEMREHADHLRARGILYAPDYVINAGGLISVFQELDGYDARQCETKVRGIFDNLLQVIDIAEERGISTARAADELAEMKLAAARRIPKQ